ncbi:MAG TPA: ornithine carbamoyltransferase [Dehalococcoidia bacterium]|nr:ornithine carbamoyltransferase [Dehalococcoidia bacterium]
MKDLLSVSDLSGDDIQLLLSDAEEIKASGWLSALDGKVMALLFEKPSLRTRVSLEIAMRQLGGQSLYLSPTEVGLGERESIPDVARVIGRYTDIIAVRAFKHDTVQTLAEYADIPVINALSDLEHPCQALTDIFTIREKKRKLAGLTLAYVGDGNNVANSLMLAASLTGMNFRIASPKGYRVQENILQLAQGYAAESGADVLCADKPQQAVAGADVVYTDVWISMGQEAEANKRRRAFNSFQVNGELMSLAREDAILMHPLPAHRGEEVSEDVLDSPQSVVFDQAENRMHLEKALLMHMLGGLEITLPGYH